MISKNRAIACSFALSLILNVVILLHQIKSPISKAKKYFREHEPGSFSLEMPLEKGTRIEFRDTDRVLVTGAAGFIGMHTSLRLVQGKALGGCGLSPAHVVGMDHFDHHYSIELKRSRYAELYRAGLKVHNASVCDSDFLKQLFQSQQFTHIIHLAAQPGFRYRRQRSEKVITNHLECFDVFLESIVRHVPRVYLIYASSSSVYGSNSKMPFSEKDRVDNPLSLEGVTKRTHELLASAYFANSGLHSTGLRLFSVYGEWGRPDMAIFKFTYSIDQENPIALFYRGVLSRDFTYISDVVDGIILACEYRAPSDRRAGLPSTGRPAPEIFNLGSGRPLRIGHVVRVLEQHLNKSAHTFDGGDSPDDAPATHADTTKAWLLMGWQPRTSFETGTRRFVAWYRSKERVRYFMDGDLDQNLVTNRPAINLPTIADFQRLEAREYHRQEHGFPQRDQLALDHRNEDEILQVRSAGLPVIAIITGSTSRDLSNVSSLRMHPVWIHLINSVFATVEDGFEYWIYIGYDQGDVLFEDPMARSELESDFTRKSKKLFQSRGIVVQIVLIGFFNPLKKPGPVFNFVSAAAFADGADFFYRVNDDIELTTPWASAMVHTLASFSPPNLGVVGPTCNDGNRWILVCDFTHRTHLSIFGTHYPPELTDWWLDDWISTVYPRCNTVRLPDVAVHHARYSHGRTAMRYQVDWSKKALLRSSVDQGKEILNYFLRRVIRDQCDSFNNQPNLNSTKNASENKGNLTMRWVASRNPVVSVGLPSGIRSGVDNRAAINSAMRVRSATKPTSAHAPQWVVIMLVSSGTLNLTLNWICTLERTGLVTLLHNAVFVSQDAYAHKTLQQRKYNTVRWGPSANRSQDGLPKLSEAHLLAYARHWLVLDLLQHNVSVAVAEPYAMWHGDLLRFVESEPQFRSADALTCDDSDEDGAVVPCDGILFLRPTAAAKALMNAVCDAVLPNGDALASQRALGKAWKAVKGKFAILPRSRFLSARQNHKRHTGGASDGTLLVHYGQVMGAAEQVARRMRQDGEWLLDGGGRCPHQRQGTISKQGK